uniref:Secreted protein n=1 Tax=Rhipicephalus appendiculatus TaxID=34631 RepID=A0A131YE37_RHIAP
MAPMKLSLVLMVALAFMVQNAWSGDEPPLDPRLYPACLFKPCSRWRDPACHSRCNCAQVGFKRVCVSKHGIRQRRNVWQFWRPQR